MKVAYFLPTAVFDICNVSLTKILSRVVYLSINIQRFHNYLLKYNSVEIFRFLIT